MREIKFRFWDGGKFLYIALSSLLEEMGEQLEAKCFSFELIPQQFTGLQDSSGKDIYEGDILMDKNQLISGIWYKVIFDKGWFMAEYIDKEGKKFRKDIAETEFLIMGNEFENPELMELKK